jgi:hypothetical protein
MHRKHNPIALAAASLALLSACGGGSESTDSSLSNDAAQGYSADASTMPVSAAAALEAAATALEAGVLGSSGSSAGTSDAGGGSGAERATALQATPNRTTALATPLATTRPVITACPGGGSVSWIASGPTLALLLNGQLDAGESYEATFNACAGTTPGLTLDGRFNLSVAASSSTAADLGLTATDLQVSAAQVRVVVNGNLRSQRSNATNASGGTAMTSRLTSASVTLASTVATRLGSYELRNLDWSVVRTRNAAGELLSTAHLGSLNLATSTTRRPAATLQIVTAGSLTLASDGAAAQGSYSLVTATDKVSTVYGSGTVTFSLDLGNNGSVERSWTINRSSFLGEAG